jgi:hypothetical protein
LFAAEFMAATGHIGHPGTPGFVDNLRRIVRLESWSQLRLEILIRDCFFRVSRLGLLGARQTRHISYGAG